jgi:hypothetical protein
MGIHATLMLAPGCSPWRPKPEPTTSPDAVTDGSGGAHMRRASNRLRGEGCVGAHQLRCADQVNLAPWGRSGACGDGCRRCARCCGRLLLRWTLGRPSCRLVGEPVDHRGAGLGARRARPPTPRSACPTECLSGSPQAEADARRRAGRQVRGPAPGCLREAYRRGRRSGRSPALSGLRPAHRAAGGPDTPPTPPRPASPTRPGCRPPTSRSPSFLVSPSTT